MTSWQAGREIITGGGVAAAGAALAEIPLAAVAVSAAAVGAVAVVVVHEYNEYKAGEGCGPIVGGVLTAYDSLTHPIDHLKRIGRYHGLIK